MVSGVHISRDQSQFFWFVILVNLAQSNGKIYFPFLHVLDPSKCSSAVCLKVLLLYDFCHFAHTERCKLCSKCGASNSSFGMLSCLIGATCVLPMSYRDLEDISALVVSKYTIAAFAVTGASVNV